MRRGATCTKGTQVARSSAYVAEGIESLHSGMSKPTGSVQSQYVFKLPHGKIGL